MPTKTAAPGTSVSVVPRPEVVVQELQGRIGSLVTECKALKVVTEDDLKTSATLRDRIAEILKASSEKRFSITRPLDAAKKAVMDLFSPVDKALVEADDSLKRQQAEFGARRRAEEEARRKIEEAEKLKRDIAEAERIAAANEALKAGVKAETVIALMPPPPPPVVVTPPAPKLTRAEDGSGVTFVEVWNVEVTNASLVPRDYLVVDESKLRKVVRAGLHSIPGCRIWPSQEPRRA
jgi:hypothetical protein